MVKKHRKNLNRIKFSRRLFTVQFIFSFILGLILFSTVAIYALPHLISAKPNQPTQSLGSYLGINNGTGYNTEPDYVMRSIRHTKDLGLGIVRMGMDDVGGRTVGEPFSWTNRDATVSKYLTSGLKIHSVLSARMMVEKDPSYEQWQENYRYFVSNVMAHYKGKIFYYIIDNEPELDTPVGKLSAQECVDMTRIAYKAAKAIDPRIKIESPPIAGVESDILDEMLARGIDKVSDYIGIHAYGGQIAEGRFGHPWRVLANRGVKKPVAISESGAIASWCPGSSAEKEDCRRRWFAIFAQQTKRYGYDHVLLFDLDGHEEWAIAPNFKPTKTYQEIKSWRLERSLANKNFESANDVESDWVHFRPGDIGDMKPSPYVTFVRGDAGGAHTGKGYVKIDSGKAESNLPISVRRIAGQLQPGKKVTIAAWAYAHGGATATLKALGYDNKDGDAEIVKSSKKKDGWEYLAITAPISKNWVVVDLGTSGTSNAGDYVKWDDVTLKML